MIATAETTKTVQEYRVYIKATPQAVWDALTQAEWTKRYGYAPLVEYELRAGGKFQSYANEGMKAAGMPDVIIDGEVIEATFPRRLVQTWRMLMDPGTAAEGFTHLTYEIRRERRPSPLRSRTRFCRGWAVAPTSWPLSPCTA
jgi:uncharacterized protein YndB with AHSA1/START domain